MIANEGCLMLSKSRLLVAVAASLWTGVCSVFWWWFAFGFTHNSSEKSVWWLIRWAFECETDWLTTTQKRLTDCWFMTHPTDRSCYHIKLPSPAILIYCCSFVCPSSNLLSIHFSIHPPKDSIHPSVHCLLLPICPCTFLFVHAFYVEFTHVCFCLFACSGAQSQNLSWSALLFTGTAQCIYWKLYQKLNFAV